MLRSIAFPALGLAAAVALMLPAPASAQYGPNSGGGIAIQTPNFSLGIGQVYQPYPVVVPGYPVYRPYYPSYYGPGRGHNHGPVVPATPHYTPGRGMHLDPIGPGGRPIHTPGGGGGYGSGYGGYRRY